MAAKYKESEKRGMQVFGISSKELNDYITSEKDILRKICRMPNPEFLIAGAEGNDDDGMEFDDDETAGDNWIMVDAAPKKVEYNPAEMEERIKRETESMRSSPSVMILSN